MTTITQARFRIEQQLVELAVDGACPLVEQVDAVLLDAGDSVIFYAHLQDLDVNGGLLLVASADLPTPMTEENFDARQYEAAFWAAAPLSCTHH